VRLSLSLSFFLFFADSPSPSPSATHSATCVDTLCRTDKACAHCSTKLDKKLPFIQLKREGTGFAAGGGVSVSKYDVAFQA
jgi:hypothetical protein